MDTNKDLLEEFDKKKKEIEKRRKQDNPEGRVTGIELNAIAQVVAGIRDRVNGQLLEEGLAQKKYDKKQNFVTKLIRNFRKAKDELEVIHEICPEYPPELKEALEEYNGLRLDIAKENAGIDKEEPVESVKMGQIISNGNKELFEGQIKELDKEYREFLDAKEEIDKQVGEIMKKPLGKPDFDLIKESEIPAELTPAEVDAIWPMLEGK